MNQSALVWFKRDLRLRDHAPLLPAQSFQCALALYVIEPQWLRSAEIERFEAWCTGRTGYPMVDACMRQLRSTGWLNFRMRAMLVSFAAYHLWLH